MYDVFYVFNAKQMTCNMRHLTQCILGLKHRTAHSFVVLPLLARTQWVGLLVSYFQ